jgi:hypothetical protein
VLGSSFGDVSSFRRQSLVESMRAHGGTVGIGDLRSAGLSDSDSQNAIIRQQQLRSGSGERQRAEGAARIAAATQAVEQARAAERVASERVAQEERAQQLEDHQRRLQQEQRRQIASLPRRQQSRASRLLRSGRLFGSSRNVNRVFGGQAGAADETNFQLQRVTARINAQKDSELAPLLRDVAASNARVAAALEADRQIHVTVDPAASSGAVAPDASSRLGGAE